MASGGIDILSDQIINNKCCICNKKNIQREAEKYCVECQDYYCTPCANMHKMFLPTSIEHKLLDKGDFGTTGQATDLPSFPTQRCNVHPTKLLDMFCKDHDEISCSSCVALKHRPCKDIHSIPDEIDSLYQPAVYEDIKCQVQAVKKSMEDLKNAKENLITKLDQYKKKAVDDIKAFRREMEAFLDRLEAESVKDVEYTYGKMVANLKQEIDEVKDYTAQLEQSASHLRESVGNKAQEFISMKFAEENIKQVKLMDKSLIETGDVRIIFQKDSKLRLLQNDFKKLGQVSKKAENIKKQKDTAYQVKSEKEISVTHSTDKQSYILGSCLLSRWLLLTDNNNDKLKRVDMSTGLMKDVCEIKASCIDVCVTNEEKLEVAVSTDQNFIQFVNIGEKMVATKQLKFDHRCPFLACKANKMFISDGDETCYIYDMTGKILHTVKSDNTGTPLFDRNRHITISGDMVYISDYDKGLIVLDINGNYNSTLTDPALRSTQWTCSDGRGNLLVGGYKSTEIVQINEASHKVICVFGKINLTLSACFDPEHNKLIVTEDEKNSVKVYELL